VKTSVIISTYNSPVHLRRVIKGLEAQTIKPFEVIIADDGSSQETEFELKKYKETSLLNIVHVWHEDQGFRKCTILNKAILESDGEYLIFLDGDCVPRRDMLETHLKYAKKNRYITGGKVHLTQEFTDTLTEKDIENNKLEKFGTWWFKSKNTRRLIAGYIHAFAYLSDRRMTKRMPGWRGENASAYKEKIVEVGGFDERFTYGLEDADLGHRLACNGVVGFSIRYTSPVYHLEHQRPYAGPENEINNDFYNENRKLKRTFTPYGIGDSTVIP